MKRNSFSIHRANSWVLNLRVAQLAAGFVDANVPFFTEGPA